MLQLFKTHYETNIFRILFKLIKQFQFVIVLLSKNNYFISYIYNTCILKFNIKYFMTH